MEAPFCQFYRPHPALQPYVANVMLMHLRLPPHLPRVEKPFPATPEQCLFFYARDAVEVFHCARNEALTSPPSIILGPQLARVNLRMGHDQITIKVGFRPGGLFRLFGVPMWELLDQTVDSTFVAGAEIRQINEELREMQEYSRMIGRVETYLLGKVAALKAGAHGIDQVAQLMQQRGASQRVSLDWLAGQACLSPRQFERKFLERVGMSPKLFLRVVRFAQAYRLKDQQPGLDWQDVVYKCGYYDQTHLIKDFRLFAGVSPTALLKEDENAGLNIYAGGPA
ncbi:AraC family transcriptional regulator [Hymenobacter properus]|uniref:AraC family transcriptional regulator n=1 Tax=Hymenobacter properus TaxID=2791026 RepID=A0A931BH87_9BACT|nr:helix-turn-helix domain-containing protein [Hymenobacter properus]MBF9143900.1 AraC family transcriptional regulator [Hymenobacter properus]MBR7722714.1 AraC family transcriptional regulator [Microvirga sp. SRT04]